MTTARLDLYEVRLAAGVDDSAEVHRKKIERMEKRLAELRKLEVQLWTEKIKNQMPEHVFKILNEPTVTEIAELQKALEEAEQSTPEPIDLQERILTLQNAIDALLDAEASVKETNLFLKECIERIT